MSDAIGRDMRRSKNYNPAGAIATPAPTGAVPVFDSEKFATGRNPGVGGLGNPGVGAGPRAPIDSYLGQFDRGNRDQFISGINNWRTTAGAAGYTPAELDEYYRTSGMADQFRGVQRNYYRQTGEGILLDNLRRRIGDDRFTQIRPDINDEITNYSYMNRPGIDTAIDQDIVNIPQTYYGTSGSNQVYDALNNRLRGQAQNRFREAFAKTPYQEIDDTADDDVINKVVGEQYGTAREGVDRQVKRGALNSFGRDNAYRTLDTRKGQVTSRLQDRGKGLLDALRTKAQGIYNSAQTGASGAGVDNPYDVNNFSTQYRSAIDSGRAGLEGNFRDQVAPDEFSTQDAIGGAASAQGPTNKSAPILAAIEARSRLKSNNRGLGTVGAF
jgi:hypothetical protein